MLVLYTVGRQEGAGLTVYIDVVFLLNWLINVLLLHAAARLRGSALTRGRFWAAGALGAVYAVCCYLPGLAFLQSWTVKLLVLAVMLMAAFGLKRQTVSSGVIFLTLAIGLCGLVYFVATVLMGVHMPIGGIYPVTFSELLLTAALAYIGGRVVMERTAVRPTERLYPVQLTLGESTVRFFALHDTGNSLRDPVSGTAMAVVSAEALGQVLGRETLRALRHQDLQTAVQRLAPYRARLIPYRAVGVSGGLLVAIRCTQLQIGKQVRTNALIALSPTPVSDRGDYAALIGGRMDETKSHGKTFLQNLQARRAENHVHRRSGCAAAPAEGRTGAAGTAANGGRR